MIKKLFAFVMISVLFLISCSQDTTEKLSDSDSEHIEANPFEERQSGETTTVGALGLGPIDIAKDTHHYLGEELEIDFFLENKHEDPLEYGFFLFLNGTPQPFRITDEEYKFFNILKLDAHEYNEFQFIFTPIAGEKGQTFEIGFAGIFHPSFVPDLEKHVTYGHHHRMSSVLPHQLIFNEPAKVTEDALPTPQEVLLHVSFSEEQISSEMRQAYEQADQNPLDEQVFFELYEADNYMTLDSGQRIIPNERIISKGENIDLVFRGFGKPGIDYRTTFYLDHRPIGSQGHTYFDWKTKAGSISTFHITLDASQLRDTHTLYSISVPLNTNEFFTDKTPSILLIVDREGKVDVSE